MLMDGPKLYYVCGYGEVRGVRGFDPMAISNQTQWDLSIFPTKITSDN